MPDIRDAFLMHQIYLSRYSTYEARKLIEILDHVNSSIKQYILKAKSVDTKAHYKRIARGIRSIMNEAVEALDQQLELDFIELADEEIQFVEKTLLPFTVETELTLPVPKKVWAAASFGPYAGPEGKYTFKSYMDSLGDKAFSLWDIACRSAYLTGTPAKSMVKTVLGSINTDNMEPGQIQGLRKSLERNTHTMVSFLAETARDAVYRENQDIFSGYKYLATLDTRTCLVCGRDDGRVFKTLEEAPKLPRHHNCRCLYVPYLKGFEDIPGERAAMDGPVSDKLTYQDWLAQQDPAVQKDILGPARFAAYQAGVPVSSFVSDGRTLTLEQLRATHGDKVPPKYAYKAVDADTEQGMQDAAYQVYAAATPESQEALKAYTRNGFSDMNNMLYGNTSYDDIIDKEVKNLDTIIKDYKLDQHIITYRGTESGYYAGWKAGSSYTLPAFVSTSIDKDNEILGDDFRMELRIKKGTTGMYIGDLSRHKTEREFLLGRGLTYKVVKKTKNTMIVEVSND